MNKNDSEKIIPFPNQSNNIKRKKDKRKIDWVLIVTVVGVLIAAVTIISDHLIDKKSEVQFKPVIDLSIEYYEDEYYGDICLDQYAKYIDKVTIKTDGKNTEPIRIKVIPFFNIIYYNQSQSTLIKQIIPISDLKGISSRYAPLDVNEINLKSNVISEIKLNENSYQIIYNMMNVFVGSEVERYDDYFSNIFADSIITSVDLEFYISISYTDIYQNDYEEVYLCETGFKKFSGYLTDFYFLADTTEIDDRIIEYNVEQMVKYAALKAHHLENLEFDARLCEIPSDDMFYSELDKYYTDIHKTAESIKYIPSLQEDLAYLIVDGLDTKQLVFILDEVNGKWKAYE